MLSETKEKQITWEDMEVAEGIDIDTIIDVYRANLAIIYGVPKEDLEPTLHMRSRDCYFRDVLFISSLCTPSRNRIIEWPREA